MYVGLGTFPRIRAAAGHPVITYVAYTPQLRKSELALPSRYMIMKQARMIDQGPAAAPKIMNST
jgi:hypothetical protein